MLMLNSPSYHRGIGHSITDCAEERRVPLIGSLREDIWVPMISLADLSSARPNREVDLRLQYTRDHVWIFVLEIGRYQGR